MPFNFINYGTFTGPANDYTFIDTEPLWWEEIPIDTSFKLTDIGVVFFNNPGDYAYFHCAGTSTSNIILEKNAGSNLPSLIAKVSQMIVNGKIIANGNIVVNGTISANNTITLAGIGDVASQINLAKALPAKPFDIPHPSKSTHRLRHVSLEGPEIGVYFRGKLINSTTITVPEYWANLVDAETITVNLTPIGSYQELFVDKIDWGKIIHIKNNSGAAINCYYTVYAERKDMDKLIVEYEGTSPKDYPGQDWLQLK